MTQSDERRVQGVNRVPVSTLVEICGNDPGVPAFEAESVDVSGRGMQVRTAYLPEEGAPLVCRFEDQGREIVVEGIVAWRNEGARGGEFGIQFTALDSNSVGALKELCSADEAPAEAAPADEPEAVDAAQSVEAGSRVRLHIDGLGSPMKARVRDGGTRKLHVGSNLEFLKVGRHLEIESLEHGGKRSATIDAVDVVIDPGSQVPQLVVALRFDDVEESTPEPSVIDSAREVTDDDEPMFAAASHASMAASDDDVDDMMDDANAFKTKLGGVAENAGAVARTTGAAFARAGGVAAVGLGKLFKGAGAKVTELREKRAAAAEASAPRRTTAAPPSGVLSAQGMRLRPQSSPAVEVEEPPVTPPWKKPRVKKAAAGAGLAVLLFTVIALAMHKPKAPPGAEPAAAKTVAVAGDVQQVDEQGNPIAAEPNAAAAAAAPLPGKPLSTPTPEDAKKGVTADVPLFGPTPMATMEPAPLGSAPDEAADPDGPAGAPAAEPPQTEEQKEMEAAKAVPDQTFPDSPPSSTKKAKPHDVHPWGRGRVHTPIVHRLRLDGPGGAIEGVVKATGFTVVIPGRKVMESGSGIQKRDKRIARVRTSNSGSGAQITFQFRDGVPGYRVRLRRDFVEFLISAPSKDNGVSSMKGHAKSHKSSHKKSAKATSASHSSKHAKKHHKKSKK